MTIKGRILLFDVVNLNRDIFPRTCNIDIPETVPLLWDCDRSKPIGFARVFRDEDGLYCEAEIMHSERIGVEDIISFIFENGKFGAGGYYTHVRMHKDDDLILVTEAKLNAVSLVLGPVRDEYYFEIVKRPEKEMAAKAARELDPIVKECPCDKCSDIAKMSCFNICVDYHDWISRLKGEIE